MAEYTAPESILIIGSGVFGLSTALALAQSPLYNKTTIQLLDRSPFPAPDGSSIDSSRIVRADYSDAAYASLAARAQSIWRDPAQGLGSEGRYTQSGLLLTTDDANPEGYVRRSFRNVGALGDSVREHDGRDAIKAAVGVGEGSGEWGYLNSASGWADAEASMVYLRSQVEATGRVEFVYGEAMELLRKGDVVYGAKLRDGSVVEGELVVLATGAWTGRLVDLRGRAQATGQVLMYMDISAEEQEALEKMPVLLNMSIGMFVIPPRKQVLKIARHGFGYTNPVSIPAPLPADGKEVDGAIVEVSLPQTKHDVPGQQVPLEGEQACRAFLSTVLPALKDRPFSYSRICWYTDTPKGDFLITYHPSYKGLFLATGGSGHGFKFLPVIGEKIVECIEGRCEEAFKEKWIWPDVAIEDVVTQDGSRGGRPGMILSEEIARKE